MPRPTSSILSGGVIALAGIAAYANSFSGPFVFDDVAGIVQNPTLPGLSAALSPPSNGLTVSGRPVLNLSLAINHALGGDNPWGYHAVNLLILILGALTLWAILRRTLGRPYLALAIALIWEVHPLLTESVTYVIQRAESLMGLFYLLTLYCFIRCTEAEAKAIFTGRSGSSGRMPSKPFLQEDRKDREECTQPRHFLQRDRGDRGGRHSGQEFEICSDVSLPDLPVKKTTAQQLLPDLPDLPVKKKQQHQGLLPDLAV